MMRFLCVSLFVVLAVPASAQDSSLADIRAELGVLNAEIARLKSELNTTGTGGGTAVTGDTLQRIDAIEAGLTRLNSKTEQLENRINRVVTDGTNRIGDLEFRLVELEGGDLGAVGQTPTLGGDEGAAPAAQVAAPSNDAPELAIGEKNDFERAQGALAEGDFRGAAAQFATFTQSYPGSPLEADAHFLRGSALEQAGDPQGAARAYLESFSGSPDSPRAPEALYKLGLSLDALGQRSEACLMLQEVGNRYPGSEQVTLASQSRASLGCS
ncbi:tol-pal system protein YbgF [uncultured Litoreibacter sp.]|uniref:tol-pal system protein YbgF n=1 Tax=uncultured Litoreibacter sp. TaxID=1392394 RepID=UPI002611DC87|nr:tol-pal system protein YbgF [uncultured Litoreibacter sp.]